MDQPMSDEAAASHGRDLWEQLLARVANPSDRTAEQFLHWIVESVVVDSISGRMANDGFAQVIGARIEKLFAAEQQRQQRPPDLAA